MKFKVFITYEFTGNRYPIFDKKFCSKNAAEKFFLKEFGNVSWIAWPVCLKPMTIKEYNKTLSDYFSYKCRVRVEETYES